MISKQPAARGAVGTLVFGLLFLVIPARSQQDKNAIEQVHQENKNLPHYNRPGANLRDELNSSGKKLLTIDEVADRGGAGDEEPPSEQEALASQVCAADAVIVGTPVSSTSLLSSNETQVFTDYVIVPTEIIKNDSAAPLAVKNKFILTRPGGTVHLDIGTIRQIDREHPILSLGMQYLFFLSRIAGSKSYNSFDFLSTYALSNDRAHLILHDTRDEAERRAAFLSTLPLRDLHLTLENGLRTCSSH